MRLTVVYDNEVYKKDAGLKSDWGFSCLVEVGGETVLFDTGAKGKILLNNLRRLGVNLEEIDRVVLSHEHWDHTGGLKAITPFLGEVEVYRFKRKTFGENMVFRVADLPQLVVEGVYTTGRLKGFVDEQALVLRGRKGWYVLVGCSHPGVGRIIEASRRYGEVVGLIGGFHGFSDFSLLSDLTFVSPCHCTRFKRRIMELFPDTSVECGVGRVFEI